MVDLQEKIIGLTVALVVLAVVLLPIGIKGILDLNTYGTDVNATNYGISTIGIVQGSTLAVIMENLPVIVLVVVLLGVMAELKRRGGEK